MLASRYLFYNKKRTFVMILSVTLASVLLFGVGLIFSSVHNYMVKTTLKENPYHVTFKSSKFEKPIYIKKIIYKDGITHIKYKKVRDTYKNTNLICKKIKCQNINYNQRLLSLYGISKKENIMNTLKIILITVLGILSFGVFILISNAFRISLIERKKQVGTLKSIGATKWQIIKTNLEEATFILIVGLVFGFILSLWLVQILVVGINFLLYDIFDVKITLTIYPTFIVISLIFIIIVLYLSCLIPSLKASHLSIINAMRANDDFKRNALPKYAFRFKIINRLAFSNYYRLKKKYRAIKLCIFVSVVLYVSFSLYLNYGLSSIDNYTNIPDYNFEIISVGDENNQKLNKLGKKHKKYKLYKTCEIEGNLSKESYLDKKDYIKKRKIIVIESNKEGIINKLKENKINEKTIKEDRKYLKYNVRLNNKGFNALDTVPYGLDSLISDNKSIFLTRHFNDYCSNYNSIMFVKGNSKNILKDLNKINTNNISYIDISKAVKLTKNFILAIKICLYSILILVITIGISSLSNTFSVNLNLRIKEIGILKAIGMTDKKLKKILMRECLIILFKTFIFIIPVCLFISYILYGSISGVIKTEMIIPKEELAISFIVSLIILYISLNINYLKFKRRQIINMISSDNV